jgi:hypothetical protein
MSSSNWPVFYLRVRAERDPGALARIIEKLVNLNFTPRRVIAEWGINDSLHVQVDIAGLPEERVNLIAEKLGQVPSIIHVHWHR